MTPELETVKIAAFSDQSLTLVIAPGTSKRVECFATSFYVRESNGPVRIKSPFFAEAILSVGLGKEAPPGFGFKMLEVHNDNAFEITVVLDIGAGRTIDRRLNIVSGRGAALGVYAIETEIEVEAALAAGTLANAAEVVFDPTPGPTHLLRQEVVITNNSATARLLLLDVNDDVIGAVPPVYPMTVTHHSLFKLRNESGSAVDVKAYTVWQKNPF
jgi:hypothetical protein